MTSIPEFRVTKKWDEAHKTLRLTVEQTQEVSERVPLFKVPIDIEIVAKNKTEEMASQVFRIWNDQASQDYYFSLESEPALVRFDQRNTVLKTLDFQKPIHEWIYQLKAGTPAVSRVHAARELALLGDQEERQARFGEVQSQDITNTIAALQEALSYDPHFWVQQEAATALGGISHHDARAALVEGTKIENPLVRQWVFTALSEWAGEEEITTLLKEAVDKDESWGCRFNASAALGHAGTKVYDFLMAALNKYAANIWIAPGVLEGLANTGDPRAVEVMKEYAAYGKPMTIRQTAVDQLVVVGVGRDDVLEVLKGLLEDKNFRVIRSALYALRDLGNRDAIPAIRRLAKTSFDGRMRQDARKAIESLQRESN